MNKEIMKKEAIKYIDSIREEIFQLSRYVYQNPELAYHEFKASSYITNYLESKNFKVEKGSDILATAIKAKRTSNKGVNIAFIAEYDALPTGHACGHNLISAMSVGAVLAADKIIEKFQLHGNAVLLGTPAEEGGGGKIHMINAGYFNDIDWAMMLHGADRTMVEDFSLAAQSVVITYHGTTAHCAASPWLGANALEAALQTFNLVNGWRCQMKDYTRVHGIMIQGGEVVNVIPDLTQVKFNIRSDKKEYLDELVKIVCNCAQCAAKAFNVTVKFEFGLAYDPVCNSHVLEKYMAENFTALGEDVRPRMKTHGIGSTDMGNVTCKIYGIHGHIKLLEGVNTHTQEFYEASAGHHSEEVILTGAKAMALTAIDLLSDESIIK